MVILVEIGQPSNYISNYFEDVNDCLEWRVWIFLDEDKEMAYVQLIAYKEKIEKYFDNKSSRETFVKEI